LTVNNFRQWVGVPGRPGWEWMEGCKLPGDNQPGGFVCFRQGLGGRIRYAYGRSAEQAYRTALRRIRSLESWSTKRRNYRGR
jgi:hypothetical protein